MTTTRWPCWPSLAPGWSVYTPADEATRRAVASLIAGDGAEARFHCWDGHPSPGGLDPARQPREQARQPRDRARRVPP